MSDIMSTILKTALTGLGIVVLVWLTVFFGTMSRQVLLMLILFILVVLLGAYVVYLVKRMDHLEEQLDKLLAEKDEKADIQ